MKQFDTLCLLVILHSGIRAAKQFWTAEDGNNHQADIDPRNALLWAQAKNYRVRRMSPGLYRIIILGEKMYFDWYCTEADQAYTDEFEAMFVAPLVRAEETRNSAIADHNSQYNLSHTIAA